MSEFERQLDQLVATVQAGRKYGSICEEFIKNIGSRELAKRSSLKDAVKATKRKLHQVGGAYLRGRMDYGRWLVEIERAYQSGDRGEYIKVCAHVMRHHSSTRERLGMLDRFYATALTHVPEVRTVVDIGCGLHPLSIPWMSLAEDIEYCAYDIYEDMVDFLNAVFALVGVGGGAQARDVTQYRPTRKADLAFLLKTVPCLERVQQGAGFGLLDELYAKHLLVTFPVATLGGTKTGMAANYEATFREFAEKRSWVIHRFEFATELAFLVTK